MQDTHLFSIKDLSFSYPMGSIQVCALDRLNVHIPAKKLVTLSGPSGSGKSTLLHLLGLIEPLQKGEIAFLGSPFSSMKKSLQNQIRRRDIGFIFQRFHLIPVLSVEENVSYFISRMGWPKSEVKKRTEEALDTVGLSKHIKKLPFELSGLQRQRVAIARALVKNPKVILADEPTANLDQTTGKGVMDLLQKLVEKGVSVIISTHDPMVLSYADMKIHLLDGKLVQQGDK